MTWQEEFDKEFVKVDDWVSAYPDEVKLFITKTIERECIKARIEECKSKKCYTNNRINEIQQYNNKVRITELESKLKGVDNERS